MSAKSSIALRLTVLAAVTGHVEAARMKRKSQVVAAATCPSTVNTFFKKEHRIDCRAFADHADSGHSDENVRRAACQREGCCWSPLEHNSHNAWCFEAPLCPMYVQPGQRKDCAAFQNHADVNSGDQDARGRACEAQGCCWQPLEEGSAEPWCFVKDEGKPADKPQRKSPMEAKITPDPPAGDDTDDSHDNTPTDNTAICGNYPELDEKSGGCVNMETDDEVPEYCCTGEPGPAPRPEEVVSERQQQKEGLPDADEEEVVSERQQQKEGLPDADEEPVIVAERQQDHDVSDVEDENDIVAIEPRPTARDNVPGTVVVYVDRAKNLPDTDSWGAGKTDAFVIVTVGGQSQTTQEVRDDLNPRWNEHFTFHIGASDAIVKVEVKDRDSWFNYWWDGHDDIHDLEVSFRGLTPGQEYMYTEYMGKETGNVHHDSSIQFRLKWNPDH